MQNLKVCCFDTPCFLFCFSNSCYQNEASYIHISKLKNIPAAVLAIIIIETLKGFFVITKCFFSAVLSCQILTNSCNLSYVNIMNVETRSITDLSSLIWTICHSKLCKLSFPGLYLLLFLLLYKIMLG